MDMNELRGIQTILVMIAFLGIVWWAYSAHRKKANDEAAHLPFDDDDVEKRTLEQEKTEKKQ
ncbi:MULTISPECIES: CcoQ/FixQ family Cbb3-type cytochrome c oxidase assembly chaperone [Marinobacter]|uniref:Cytochrome oxidase n=1 Tax=Marinobacter similis TaxID=1420916 RepID=W5YMG3_9GAMM|nr:MULTISPECIES: CcoQ/FixQ family Cbb3-type cytochrome c oxidase assembly chaperone [Marinobacter]AHI27688.1 cytochrome oxidase [Marinobacter similis]MCK2147909.1 CcoQ/FixQ family Cbb3-type cytochrome c oxidase assembly chaperone [Marinobacter alexandrii]